MPQRRAALALSASRSPGLPQHGDPPRLASALSFDRAKASQPAISGAVFGRQPLRPVRARQIGEDQAGIAQHVVAVDQHRAVGAARIDVDRDASRRAASSASISRTV